MAEATRTVGERGQVTLPEELRERFDIQGGDEVVVRETDDRPTSPKDTAGARNATNGSPRRWRGSRARPTATSVTRRNGDDSQLGRHRHPTPDPRVGATG